MEGDKLSQKAAEKTVISVGTLLKPFSTCSHWSLAFHYFVVHPGVNPHPTLPSDAAHVEADREKARRKRRSELLRGQRRTTFHGDERRDPDAGRRLQLHAVGHVSGEGGAVLLREGRGQHPVAEGICAAGGSL